MANPRQAEKDMSQGAQQATQEATRKMADTSRAARAAAEEHDLNLQAERVEQILLRASRDRRA